jgi:hypothetical protein
VTRSPSQIMTWPPLPRRVSTRNDSPRSFASRRSSAIKRPRLSILPHPSDRYRTKMSDSRGCYGVLISLTVRRNDMRNFRLSHFGILPAVDHARKSEASRFGSIRIHRDLGDSSEVVRHAPGWRYPDRDLSSIALSMISCGRWTASFAVGLARYSRQSAPSCWSPRSALRISPLPRSRCARSRRFDNSSMLLSCREAIAIGADNARANCPH